MEASSCGMPMSAPTRAHMGAGLPQGQQQAAFHCWALLPSKLHCQKSHDVQNPTAADPGAAPETDVATAMEAEPAVVSACRPLRRSASRPAGNGPLRRPWTRCAPTGRSSTSSWQNGRPPAPTSSEAAHWMRPRLCWMTTSSRAEP